MARFDMSKRVAIALLVVSGFLCGCARSISGQPVDAPPTTKSAVTPNPHLDATFERADITTPKLGAPKPTVTPARTPAATTPSSSAPNPALSAQSAVLETLAEREPSRPPAPEPAPAPQPQPVPEPEPAPAPEPEPAPAPAPAPAPEPEPEAEPSSDGCVIKGNISSKGERIYHVPGQQSYEKTVISFKRGERWFCSEEAAEAAGWRKAKR